MVEFYETKVQGVEPARMAVVRWAEVYTQKYSTMLGVSRHAQVLLCIDHRESDFRKNLVDPVGDSYGVGQVLRQYNPGLRKFYLKFYGVKLGADSRLETQVAFSVAMFKFKLDARKGNAYAAVMAYNGAGAGARHYRKKVITTLKVVYGMDLRPDGRYVKWRNRK